jgi:hypothetical protein
VLDLFIALGFACVLVMLGYAAFERTTAALAAAVLAVGAYSLILAFLTSFGTTFSHSVQHPAPAAEILARCRKLLARHDFVFSGESAGSLEAARGAGAGAETKWRSCPLEVRATVASEGSAALLTVQCTGEAGRHRFVRRLIRRTAEAAANLDRPTLKALDKTLVRRPGALFQGGLGTSVLAAMLVCAVISAAALVGVSYRLAAYVLDLSQASAAVDDMRRLQVQLTSRIDVAERRGRPGLPETGEGERHGCWPRRRQCAACTL